MWIDKDEWVIGDGGGTANRRTGKTQHGAQGTNHLDPLPYLCYRAKFPLTRVPPPGNPDGLMQFDAPNCGSLYSLQIAGVPFPVARNKAWGAMVEQIRRTTSDLAVTMAEWNESLAMIANRLGQLVRAARHLRKGRFKAFLKELGIRSKRKHKRLVEDTSLDFASLWLEYSFGWSPLCGDIYNACEAITQPLPMFPSFGKGKEDWSYTRFNWWVLQMEEEGFGTGRCKQGCLAYIENPNLYLLQQVGLINPLLVVWEVIPFSFVVDWFTDVGSFLAGISDLLGLRIEQAYTTYSVKGAPVTHTWVANDAADSRSISGTIQFMRRDLGLSQPMPNLSFLANIGRNLKRATNAAALLRQLL